VGVRFAGAAAGHGRAARPRPQPALAAAGLRGRRQGPDRLLPAPGPRDRRHRPRLHQPDLGHPLPRRPLPGPLGGRAQALCAAADAGVRRILHPRLHADPGPGRLRPAGGAPDRPHLRLRALPADGVSSPVRRLAAPRAGDQRPRAGPARAGRRARRGHQPLCRRHRPFSAADRGHAGERCEKAQGRAGLPSQPRRRRLASARPAARRAGAGHPTRRLRRRAGALLSGRGRGPARRHPRQAIPLRRRQPALHHRQGGEGAEPGLSGQVSDLSHEVFPRRTLHRAVLRPLPFRG